MQAGLWEASGERGSSEVLGAILVFAILVAAISAFQVTVVPQQNERAEFDAYRNAITDVAEVNTQIVRTAAQGTEGSATIRTGVRYPARAVTLNPPDPIGSVELTSAASASVLNARAVDPDEADYWDGSARSFPTQRLRFRPAYNRFEAGPVTATGSLVYRQPVRGTPIRVSDQSIVRGTRLSLVAVRGEMYAANELVTLSTTPVSTAARTVRITGNDADGDDAPEPIEIEVPTDLDDATWNALLAGQIGSDPNQNVQSVSVSGGVATVVLDGSKTYTLQLSKVEVRERSDDTVVASTDPAYVVSRADTKVTTTDAPVTLSVQVLDTFGNPVAGESVSFSDDSSGTFSQSVVPTDDRGWATVEYSNGATGDATVEARCDDCVGSSAATTVTFDVTVTGGPESVNRAPTVEILDIEKINSNRNVFDVTVRATDPDGNLAGVEVRLTDPNVDDPDGTSISGRSENVNGGSEVVTVRLDTDDTETNGDNRLNEYHIAIVVQDGDGAIDSESVVTSGQPNS
jgi:hypothetical protein